VSTLDDAIEDEMVKIIRATVSEGAEKASSLSSFDDSGSDSEVDDAAAEAFEAKSPSMNGGAGPGGAPKSPEPSADTFGWGGVDVAVSRESMDAARVAGSKAAPTPTLIWPSADALPSVLPAVESASGGLPPVLPPPPPLPSALPEPPPPPPVPVPLPARASGQSLSTTTAQPAANQMNSDTSGGGGTSEEGSSSGSSSRRSSSTNCNTSSSSSSDGSSSSSSGDGGGGGGCEESDSSPEKKSGLAARIFGNGRRASLKGVVKMARRDQAEAAITEHSRRVSATFKGPIVPGALPTSNNKDGYDNDDNSSRRGSKSGAKTTSQNPSNSGSVQKDVEETDLIHRYVEKQIISESSPERLIPCMKDLVYSRHFLLHLTDFFLPSVTLVWATALLHC